MRVSTTDHAEEKVNAVKKDQFERMLTARKWAMKANRARRENAIARILFLLKATYPLIWFQLGMRQFNPREEEKATIFACPCAFARADYWCKKSLV